MSSWHYEFRVIRRLLQVKRAQDAAEKMNAAQNFQKCCTTPRDVWIECEDSFQWDMNGATKKSRMDVKRKKRCYIMEVLSIDRDNR